jgi:pimeloyl-ACP methyl ester carboxylesterase
VVEHLLAGEQVDVDASNSRLAGALAQSPLVDGLAAAAMAPPLRSLRLFSLAVQDRLGSILGRPPRYLPGAGAPGELAVGATEDALFGEKLMTPKDSTEWHNRVAARSLLSFSWRRPVRRAASIRCPVLLVVAEHDTMAPVRPALRVAEKAPDAELYRSRGGHYDVYEGGEDHDNVLRVEVNSSTDTHDFSRDEPANEVVARDSWNSGPFASMTKTKAAERSARADERQGLRSRSASRHVAVSDG